MTKRLDQNQQLQTNNKSNKPENPWVEIAQTIVLALCLSFGIRTFVAEARYIPSSSMEPTLLINDRLIIEKMSYHFGEPKRGDIVVFNPTATLQESGYDEAFIKRIIAVPGDQVQLKDGQVLIKNHPLSENYTSGDKTYTAYPRYINGMETKPQSICGNQIPFLSGVVTIPKDSYLVLGDNRANSYDSRCWGLVPKDKIIGRASVRFWPPQRVGMINGNSVYAETIPNK
jgi:signal peptidase I